jgi:predicted amidohydrolase
MTEAWKVVMPVRAIENNVYVAVSNRAGKEKRGDEELQFKGNSAIYDYKGVELCKASPLNDEILMADIYPWKTRNKFFNPINDVLRDRQPQFYGRLAEK